MTIHSQRFTLGPGGRLDLFAQTVSDQLAVQYTPAHLVIVQNDGSGTIYLGGPDVAVPAIPPAGQNGEPGIPLGPNKNLRISLSHPDRLWAVNGDAGPANSIGVLIVLE